MQKKQAQMEVVEYKHITLVKTMEQHGLEEQQQQVSNLQGYHREEIIA